MLFELRLHLCGKDVEPFWVDDNEYNIIILWSNTMILIFGEKLKERRECQLGLGFHGGRGNLYI